MQPSISPSTDITLRTPGLGFWVGLRQGISQPWAVDLPLFDMVAEAVRSLLPAELADFRYRARRYGLKLWFGSEKPQREHYEAQVISPDGVDEATVLALEIGFHAEHPDVADNDAVISLLVDDEPRWRPGLGDEAVVGPFLGRADVWRRVSETWPDPDLDDEDLAVEVALRLVDYVAALEPVRRREPAR